MDAWVTTSVQAELVAFRVAHDICRRPAIAVRPDQSRAESDQAFDLGGLLLGIDMDVEMYPVFGDLSLGHALEKSRGSTSAGSRHAATSRNAERPLTTIPSSAGMRPAAINWSTNAEWSSTAEPKTWDQNAAWACGSAQSNVTWVLIANHLDDRRHMRPPATRDTRQRASTSDRVR